MAWRRGAEALSIGINYGQIGDNLPSPSRVSYLLQSMQVSKVKLYVSVAGVSTMNSSPAKAQLQPHTETHANTTRCKHSGTRSRFLVLLTNCRVFSLLNI